MTRNVNTGGKKKKKCEHWTFDEIKQLLNVKKKFLSFKLRNTLKYIWLYGYAGKRGGG